MNSEKFPSTSLDTPQFNADLTSPSSLNQIVESSSSPYTTVELIINNQQTDAMSATSQSSVIAEKRVKTRAKRRAKNRLSRSANTLLNLQESNQDLRERFKYLSFALCFNTLLLFLGVAPVVAFPLT
ncbi:unnamed protein product [Rotaria sp. Silwood2]|nr:unnamed protein product [Rotaria sp. Silwood2]CAF3084921.1 unnamed protein product [Rotaria sp. Silwood2]CAF3404526.1 unnamed protein product [Rotaria sp. Silwood2]CAF4364168.1 unnamed protein product [Rotaria sp. Silwood2]CAF4391735.1 unnamed protein product [Rotaria sp. Silwood2]